MVRERSSDVSAESRKLVRAEELIRVWIWEYVLKNTSDLRIVRGLAEALPFPDDVPRLKQMTLIRELADILQSSKDLDIRQTLGILEALEHSFGKEPVDLEDVVLSKRLKTSAKGNVKVTGLRERTSSEPRRDAGDEAVRKGLQQPILELKGDLRGLLGRPGGGEAGGQDAKLKVIEGKLSALVKHARALFGPAFLEKAEAAVLSGKYKPEGVSLGLPLASGQNVAGTAGDNEANPRNEEVSARAKRVVDECYVVLQKNVLGRNEEMEKARLELADRCADMEKVVNDPLPALLRKAVATAEPPQTSPGERRQTVEVEEPVKEPLPALLRKPVDAAEVPQTTPGKERQTAEIVKEPLPAPLRKPVDAAEVPQTTPGRERQTAELGKIVKDPVPALLRKPVDTAEVPQTTQGEERQTAEPAVKRSLFEPHPSAQAEAWEDDEIEESPSRGGSPSASRRLHLPPMQSLTRTTLRPRKATAGEASSPTVPGLKQRRPKKKWSDAEVEILKRGVHTYGKGYWKVILQTNKDSFHGRTEVDLKDKWRNLEKYGVP